MSYVDFKDLTRKTFSDKILCDKAFHIAKSPKCHGYQRGLASMVYKCFDKKPSGSGIKNENISNIYTHLLWTIFGVIILLICSYKNI